MRFPFTKIYRAFPELDNYRDDQCERFVTAARGRRWQRFGRLCLTLVVAVVSQVLLWGAILFAINFAMSGIPSQRIGEIRAQNEGLFILAMLLLSFVAGLIGFLPALVLRDRMLLAQIRNVLIERGFCIKCHYSLIGLPVSQRKFVECPSCKKPVALTGTESPDCPTCKRSLKPETHQSEWVVICAECGCPGLVDSSLSELTINPATSTLAAADN